MLKEIFEQPKIIGQTLSGRITPDLKEIKLGGLDLVFPKLLHAQRIIILGCGSSWHAALIGKYLIEQYAGICVEVDYASEFRYRKPLLNKSDIVIAISQSGETADTLAAVRMAGDFGVTTVGICNVVGSGIGRETDAGVYTHAGHEIGVASTKAFTAQITVLTLLAVKLAIEKNQITKDISQLLIKELLLIPQKIQSILERALNIKEVAAKYKNSSSALFLGRGVFFPVALEGALKLKEISYIHAEGYAAGEMKHGPIALIDENLPVIAIASRHSQYPKIVSNIQEVMARKGKIIAVITEGDSTLKDSVDNVFEIPDSHELIAPILAIIPLQLFSYYMALNRGCNVDQPRNLAKSVTVE